MNKHNLIIFGCVLVILAGLFNFGRVVGAWFYRNESLTQLLHPQPLLFIFAAISVFFVLKSTITQEKLKRTR